MHERSFFDAALRARRVSFLAERLLITGVIRIAVEMYSYRRLRRDDHDDDDDMSVSLGKYTFEIHFPSRERPIFIRKLFSSLARETTKRRVRHRERERKREVKGDLYFVFPRSREIR